MLIVTTKIHIANDQGRIEVFVLPNAHRSAAERQQTMPYAGVCLCVNGYFGGMRKAVELLKWWVCGENDVENMMVIIHGSWN